jgi:hypothetical protein
MNGINFIIDFMIDSKGDPFPLFFWKFFRGGQKWKTLH